MAGLLPPLDGSVSIPDLRGALAVTKGDSALGLDVDEQLREPSRIVSDVQPADQCGAFGLGAG
jgi:hypothetical protein